MNSVESRRCAGRRFSDEIIYVPGRGTKKIKDLSCKDMKRIWHSSAMRRRVRQQLAREQEPCQPS